MTNRRMHVELDFAGWPSTNGIDTHKTCSTVLERKVAGLPPCTEIASWKVDTYGRGWAQTAYYCDEHVPEEVTDAHAVQEGY